MDEKKIWADRFEANRSHLKAVAYRMLGSSAEAEDAVQEAWLRLSRTDAATLDNLGGWLTTVVARVCLDMLRSRKSRREEPLGPHVPEPIAAGADEPDHDTLMADSVGLALLVVLEKLAPAERVAFVLHDMFNLPFDQIAAVVGRSAAATRQLASRARRRVQGTSDVPSVNLERQRAVVDAFLAASREGNLEGIIAALAPDIVFRTDAVAAQMSGLTEVRGAAAVAEIYKGRAQAARTALVDGRIGVAVHIRGHLRFVLRLTMDDDKITAIEAFADPKRIGTFEITNLDA